MEKGVDTFKGTYLNNIMDQQKKFKVLIGYPPINSPDGATPTLGQNRQFQYFKVPTLIQPIILSSAATLLKYNGYDVNWMDCVAENIIEKDFLSYLDKEEPNLFIFETKVPIIKQNWDLINKLKKYHPKMRIAICGDHPTAYPEESLENSNVDFVITGGDYDFMALELCNSLKHKKRLPPGIYYIDTRSKDIKCNGKVIPVHNLDNLPFIDRELTKWKNYQQEYNIPVKPYAYIMSARDCWYGKCSFCIWPQTLFKGDITKRTRSVKNVLDEIGSLIDKYNIKEVFDDSGTLPIVGGWLREFCNGMIERGYNKKIKFSCNMRFGVLKEEDFKLMKEAGFRLLKFGLESGNQITFDKINKGITLKDVMETCKLAKNVGLTVHLTEIVSWPWETEEDLNETYKLVNKIMLEGSTPVYNQCTIAMPYPGTKLYTDCLNEELFRFPVSPENGLCPKCKTPVIEEKGKYYCCPKEQKYMINHYEDFAMQYPILKTKLNQEAIKKFYDKIYRIYFNPRFIIKIIPHYITHPKYLFNSFRAVIGHFKTNNSI